jgi:diaminopimelate decarboxylase
MFYPHVISSLESEVAIPKVQEIFSQEIESLHLLRINPKHSAHNHVLNADYNQSSEWYITVGKFHTTETDY